MCASRGGGGIFLEIKKRFLILEKNVPDCAHPWVKIPIQNVVLRVSRRRKPQNFSQRGIVFFTF